MRATFCIVIFALIAPCLRAQTNLTQLLQQGMFEEQANHNIAAAIADYEALSTQFDKDRQLAATAIFRLGECYREEAQTNQAAMEYRRILNEFPDQRTLVTLSQEDLAGMGMAVTPTVPATEASPENSVAPPGPNSLIPEIWNRVRRLSPAELEKVLPTLVPDPMLTSLLQRRNTAETELAQKRTYLSEENPEVAAEKAELSVINQQITNRISGMMEGLKIQYDATVMASSFGTPAQPSAPPSDEDQEIARLQAMLQNSPDLINAPDDGGRTPLANAAAKGQLKVAAFLLDHGADANRTTRGGSPLYWAADSAQRTMVQFLLDHGADVNAGGGEALKAAIKHGYEAVAETLLKAHANVNLLDNIGQTPLDLAAADGRTQFIQMLLDSGADPNIPDNWGGTPLSHAAHLGGTEVIENVKLLLAAKADPNGGRCDLPLLCAINNRDVKAAELLLQAGANPNLKSQVTLNLVNLGSGPIDSVTPIWGAVSMGDAQMVRLLLQYKADPNDVQINNTPVIFSAVVKTNVLQALLDAGANPNVTDDKGRTPLSYAAQAGVPTAVSLLLAAKADPNADTVDAPLLCAVDKHDPASAELLLQAGANPNVDGLMHCQQGSYGSGWNPEYNGILRKATPLWLATLTRQLPMVQLLLKYKANPDAQTSEPPAVIFWALSDTNILQALLDGGANPNVRNDHGETPLRIAENVLSGNAGFGDNIPPDQQKTIAASVADLLRQHGALEVLPDWDHITISSPSGKNSLPVFNQETNDWNQLTLFELLYYTWDRTQFQMHFADFAHIIIVRPGATGETSKKIPINLLNSTNGVDCSQDVALNFGDVVEIPQREHTLAENDTQISRLIGEMSQCLKDNAGTAKLIVDGGQTIQLPLTDFEPLALCIHYVLGSNLARNVLTSDSDLSRVKVTRGEKTWTVDCSNQNQNYDYSDLWVRNGDVIEVPQTR